MISTRLVVYEAASTARLIRKLLYQALWGRGRIAGDILGLQPLTASLHSTRRGVRIGRALVSHAGDRGFEPLVELNQ